MRDCGCARRRCKRCAPGDALTGYAARRWLTLEVAGKHSGRTVTFALRMAERNGRCYLVPMLEADCNWVRNVRAIDGRIILRRGKRTARLLVEIPTRERALILRRYLRGSREPAATWRQAQKAPLQDFAAISCRCPVFSVTPDSHAPAAVSPSTLPSEERMSGPQLQTAALAHPGRD